MNQQLNNPGLIEAYLMQISTQIYYLDCSVRKEKSPKSVTLQDFKLDYLDPLKQIVKKDSKEVARAAMSRWCGAVGLTKVQV